MRSHDDLVAIVKNRDPSRGGTSNLTTRYDCPLCASTITHVKQFVSIINEEMLAGDVKGSAGFTQVQVIDLRDCTDASFYLPNCESVRASNTTLTTNSEREMGDVSLPTIAKGATGFVRRGNKGGG